MKIIGIGIIAFLLYLLQQWVYKRLWDKHLSVSISFVQKGIHEGDTGEITEIVENRKYLPLTMLKVKFQTSRNLEFDDNPGSNTTDQYYRNDVFQVGGGEKITRKLTFCAKKRGYYHIKNIDLVGTDLFLKANMIKSMSTSCYLYVYPRLFDTHEFRLSLQKLNGEILVKRHLTEDPFELRGIREYQPFDDMRSVNWKATAKTGNLMVNQKNYTALEHIRIFLNIEDSGVWKREAEVEACLQIVMGLSSFLLSQGIKVECFTNGRDIITDEAVYVDGGAGSGQQDVIGKALARLDTVKAPLGFCQLFEDEIVRDTGAAVTLFVSPNGYDDFLRLLERCQTEGITYTWFYPYDSAEEPEVPEHISKFVRFLRIKK